MQHVIDDTLTPLGKPASAMVDRFQAVIKDIDAELQQLALVKKETKALITTKGNETTAPREKSKKAKEIVVKEAVGPETDDEKLEKIVKKYESLQADADKIREAILDAKNELDEPTRKELLKGIRKNDLFRTVNSLRYLFIGVESFLERMEADTAEEHKETNKRFIDSLQIHQTYIMSDFPELEAIQNELNTLIGDKEDQSVFPKKKDAAAASRPRRSAEGPDAISRERREAMRTAVNTARTVMKKVREFGEKYNTLKTEEDADVRRATLNELNAEALELESELLAAQEGLGGEVLETGTHEELKKHFTSLYDNFERTQNNMTRSVNGLNEMIRIVAEKLNKMTGSGGSGSRPSRGGGRSG